MEDIEIARSAKLKKIDEIAQAHAGTGIHIESEALIIACGLTVGISAVFHSVQFVDVLLVVRVHAQRPLHMLQCRDLVAQTLVGKSA